MKATENWEAPRNSEAIRRPDAGGGGSREMAGGAIATAPTTPSRLFRFASSTTTSGQGRSVRYAIITLLFAFVTLRAQPSEPMWSKNASVRGYFADLLKLGGFGFGQWEAAAFLMLSPDGRYRCIAWPFSNGHKQQSYRGRVPDFTIAIVHTHPRKTALPSSGDRSTAKRLGIPVIVLTTRNIYVVTADGRIVEVVRDNLWIEAADPATHCEPPDQRAVRVAGVPKERSGRAFACKDELAVGCSVSND